MAELNGDFVGLQRPEPPLLRRAWLTLTTASIIPVLCQTRRDC